MTCEEASGDVQRVNEMSIGSMKEWLREVLKEARTAFREEVRELLREERGTVPEKAAPLDPSTTIPRFNDEDVGDTLHKWATYHYKSYHSGLATKNVPHLPQRAHEDNSSGQYAGLPDHDPDIDMDDLLLQSGLGMVRRQGPQGGREQNSRREDRRSLIGTLFWCCWRMWRKVILSRVFEYLLGVLIIANSLVDDLKTDFQILHPGEPVPDDLRITIQVFCVIFWVEIMSRVISEPGQLLPSNDRFWWNAFDVVAVFLQILDVFILPGCPIVALFRCLQLWRVGRLVRELRVITESIVNSMVNLAFVLILFLFLLHTSSVFCCQAIIHTGGPALQNKHLQYWFSSVWRSFLTNVGCILGGVNWDEVIEQLLESCGFYVGIAMSLYIVFCMIAILNFLTGVFVDRTLSDANAHRRFSMAAAVRDLFFAEGAREHITFEEFQEKLHHKDMQEYFQTLDLDIGESQALFELLDIDGCGGLSSEEMVDGCLRLSGPALAIETALIMKELVRLQGFVQKLGDELRPRRAVRTKAGQGA